MTDEYENIRGAFIHKTAVFGSNVSIGHGAIIGPYTRLHHGVEIGPYAVIGGPPEFFPADDKRPKSCGVSIHEYATIGEFVTVHGGVRIPTQIGPGAHVFNHSHIAHDCRIEEDAVIGGQVSLAGHTVVGMRAQIAGKSCTHQWVVVGAFAFVGPMGYLRNHVAPGEKWLGHPLRHAGLNKIGLERANVSIDLLEEYRRKWSGLIEEPERKQLFTPKGTENG